MMQLPMHAPSVAELHDQVHRLNQEKRELQDYADRVTRELRRYQTSRPPPAARAEDDMPLPPWATNLQMMSPLLFAYEERISELQTSIERSLSMADQVQLVTRENDALRAELHERTEQLRNTQMLAPVRAHDSREGPGALGGDQPDDLQELYRLSVEQNEALAQQNQLLKLQLERMQQTLVVTQHQAREVHGRAAQGAQTFTFEQERFSLEMSSREETFSRELRAEQDRASRSISDTQERATRDVRDAHEHATRTISEAKEHATRAVSEAQEHASRAVLEAQEHASKAVLEARENASRAVQEAQDNASRTIAEEQERAARALAEEQDRAARALADVQERAEAYALQRGAAEAQLREVTNEVVEEVRVREHLEAQVTGLQQELRHVSQSLERYRRSFDDRVALAADEHDRLQAELERTSHNERELREREAILEQELSEATSQLFAARREGEATRQEAEQMLRLLESMERQLRDHRVKHERVQQELVDREGACRVLETQLGELLLARDAWTAADHTSRRQADRLERRLQGEIDALRHQRDQEVDTLIRSEKNACADLEERLRRSEHAASEFRQHSELAEQKRSWAAAELERRSDLHAVEKERLQGDLEEVQQARLLIDRQVDVTRKEASRFKSELDAAIAEAREGSMRANSELTSHRVRLQAAERALGQAKEEVQSCGARLAAATAEHARLHSEVQEERGKANNFVELERQRVQSERRALERQLQALESRARQEAQRATGLMREQEALQQRTQVELGLEREALEAQVERLSRENQSLKEKTRNMLKAMALRRGSAGTSSIEPLLALSGSYGV